MTSDHPVVVWPLERGSHSRPVANDLRKGVIDTLEVFVPVGPSHVLLFTWTDTKSAETVRAGSGSELATANAFVVANADAQWFHEPDAKPLVAQGRRAALSSMLVSDYGKREAKGSQRRAMAAGLANAEAKRDISNDPVEIVSEERLPPAR